MPLNVVLKPSPELSALLSRYVRQRDQELTLLKGVSNSLGRLVEILDRLITTPTTLEGGQFMFIIKADHADVDFAVVKPIVTDSEGHAIADAPLDIEIRSDNDEAVSLNINEDGISGTAHFGAPGIANIVATVKKTDGTLLGSFGAQFTVTTGDPAAITGGSISFAGIEEAQTPAPETPTE